MAIELPSTIAGYFAADSDPNSDVARCFTENAIVKDEKRTYKGQHEIRQWKADASRKFSYKSEPFACEDKDGHTIVTSKLTGSFPGSPVDLRYIFGLEGGRIAYLEITP